MFITIICRIEVLLDVLTQHLVVENGTLLASVLRSHGLFLLSLLSKQAPVLPFS